jgi:hypothetical protein
MSVAFVTQLADCMLCVIVSSMAHLVLNVFPHYLINCTIFRKKLLNITCVLISSISFVQNIYQSEKNSVIY